MVSEEEERRVCVEASVAEEPPGMSERDRRRLAGTSSQAKRQSRSPRGKVERDDIPGDVAQRAETHALCFFNETARNCLTSDTLTSNMIERL